MMITLYNVTDLRTGKFHSVAIIPARLARWFVEAVE